jgi:ATP-dependent protease ClpP protease subunit
MKLLRLPLVIAAMFATNDDLAQIAPESRGTSIIALSTAEDEPADLLIYGPIGDYFWDGITASSIVEQISRVTASEINVRIDSDGGVVHDGLAIYNALKSHPAKVRVTIDGIAASIASLVAMAGDTVRMYRNTMLMAHAPMGGVFGNAAAMRRHAAILEKYAAAMRESYIAKTGKAEEIDVILSDGQDHYFTAAEAIEFGFADAIVDAESDIPSDSKVAAAALLSYITAISATPPSLAAQLRQRIQATCSAPAFASLREGHQRAIYAQLEDSPMKQQCHLILAQANGAAVAAAAAAAIAANAASDGSAAAVAAAPAAVAAASPLPVVPPQVPADPIVVLAARNDALRGVFAQFRDVTGVTELEASCLADPRLTIEQAQARLLGRIGGGATPLTDPALAARTGLQNGAGLDERDHLHARIVDGILARNGVLVGQAAITARQGNPSASSSLLVLAEQSLQRAGVRTRDMDRMAMATMVLAAQTTSDFPVLLENALNRTLLAAYALAPFTWNRFCATGVLTDFRPHNRYHMSSFSDLKEVNEHGEYENGVLGDGKKETIQGKRKGRILQITPEVIVNDDMGALVNLTQTLSRAAGRTIEKDVYATFGLNSGNGPTMQDGQPLFHASHNNIAATAGAPSVELVDQARQLLASQKDTGGEDFLDLVAAIFLGPLSLGGKAREVNAAEYNDESGKNQRRPNVVRGLYRDIVDTARLSGTAWFTLADPNIEPVLEVAFLDGVQTPTLVQETNFRTSGLSWKVEHRYGVAGVGYRGAVKNAGG